MYHLDSERTLSSKLLPMPVGNPKGPGGLPGPLAIGSKGCSVAANAAVGHCFFRRTDAPVLPPSEVEKL